MSVYVVYNVVFVGADFYFLVAYKFCLCLVLVALRVRSISSLSEGSLRSCFLLPRGVLPSSRGRKERDGYVRSDVARGRGDHGRAWIAWFVCWLGCGGGDAGVGVHPHDGG